MEPTRARPGPSGVIAGVTARVAGLARSRANQRMALITVDQVLSGASNIATILLVAHVLSPSGFGRFTIVFLVYSVGATASRALLAGPLLVHPEDASTRLSEVFGSALLVTAMVSGVCAAAAGLLIAVGSALGTSILVLAALLPLLLLQDLARYVWWACARPGWSVVVDATWIAVEVAVFGAVLVTGGTLTLLGCVTIWGVSGALAGAVALVAHRSLSLHHLNLRWARARWHFSGRFLISTISGQVSVFASVTVIAWFSSAAAVAAVRAVTLLTRPGYTIQEAIGQSTATDIARERPGRTAIRGHVRRALALASLVALANAGVLLILPDTIGSAIMGNTWPLAAPLALPAGLELVAAALATGRREALLGRHLIGTVMTLDILGSALLVIASSVGAAADGARGVLWGGVAAMSVRTLVWWLAYTVKVTRGPDTVRGRDEDGARGPGPAPASSPLGVEPA